MRHWRTCLRADSVFVERCFLQASLKGNDFGRSRDLDGNHAPGFVGENSVLNRFLVAQDIHRVVMRADQAPKIRRSTSALATPSALYPSLEVHMFHTTATGAFIVASLTNEGASADAIEDSPAVARGYEGIAKTNVNIDIIARFVEIPSYVFFLRTLLLLCVPRRPAFCSRTRGLQPRVGNRHGFRPVYTLSSIPPKLRFMYTIVYIKCLAQGVMRCPGVSQVRVRNVYESRLFVVLLTRSSWVGIESMVGVRNDRKRAPPRDFARQIGEGGAHFVPGNKIRRSTAASSRPTVA